MIPADGGDEQQVASDPSPPIGWSADSETVAFDAQGGISLVPASGGDTQVLAPDIHAPGDWSPDGKTIAGSEGAHIRLVDVASATSPTPAPHRRASARSSTPLDGGTSRSRPTAGS